MPDSRYRITERLGAGRTSEAFKAVAESLQGFRKTVVIKRVLPSLANNQALVSAFLEDARLSLTLQHANIVQLYDIGCSDGTYFIVMEFVDGLHMKAILEWRRRITKRLTIGQTLYIVMEICKGLAYVHNRLDPETKLPLGIVVGNVSPANVIVSLTGEIKLGDFVLGKAASKGQIAAPGVVPRNVSYLSPEAARDEDVDHRADIFSVGILLYEMLTSKRLFYGATDHDTVDLVRQAKIPPIAAQNAEVERELEEICRKALARRVGDRFQTATDLQDAIAHYLFSRGLKMLQRDIADLVRACVEDRDASDHGAHINAILSGELDAFRSADRERYLFGAKPDLFAAKPDLFAAPPDLFAAKPDLFAAPSDLFAAPPNLFATKPDLPPQKRTFPPAPPDPFPPTRSKRPVEVGRASPPGPPDGSARREHRSLFDQARRWLTGGDRAQRSPAIFISYRRADSGHAVDSIGECLRKEFGKQSVFQDIDNIPPGADFREHIEHSLVGCRLVVAVIGKDWLGGSGIGSRIMQPDDPVRVELEWALAAKTRIFPVLTDETKMPSKKDLPESLGKLSDINALHYRSGRDKDSDTTSLLHWVGQALKGAAERP